MRLQKARIEGFGKLCNAEFSFGPGLNIIYGENESGKSTLMRFIIHMLYGLKKPGLKRKVYMDEYDKYTPWNSQQYGGTLIYECRGRIYRLERNMNKDQEEVWIFDMSTGSEITKEFPMDDRREVLFAPVHVGLSDSLFYSSLTIGPFNASFHQERTKRDALYRDIQGSMAQKFQPNEDSSLTRAVLALRRALEEVGTDKTRNKPLGILNRRIEELQTRLRQMESFRDEILNLEKEKGLKEDEIEQLEYRLENMRRILDSKKKAELQRRLFGLEDAAGRIEAAQKRLEELGIVPEGPFPDLENLSSLFKELQLYKDQVRSLEDEISVLESQLSRFSKDMDFALEDSVDLNELHGLSELYQTYLDGVQQYKAKERDIEGLIEIMKKAEKKLSEYRNLLRDPNLPTLILELENRMESLKQEETGLQLERLEEKKKSVLTEQGKNRLMLLLSGTGFIAGLLLGIILHFLFYLLCPIAFAGFLWAFQKRKGILQRLDEINSEIENQESLFAAREAEKQKIDGILNEIYNKVGIRDLSVLKERINVAGEIQREWSETKEKLDALDLWLENRATDIARMENQIIQGLRKIGYPIKELNQLTLSGFYGIIEECKHRLEQREHYRKLTSLIQEKKAALETAKGKFKEQVKKCVEVLSLEAENGEGFFSETDRLSPFEIIDLLREYHYYKKLYQELLQGDSADELKAELEAINGRLDSVAASSEEAYLEPVDGELKKLERQLAVAKGQKMVIDSKLKDYHDQLEDYEDIEAQLYQAKKEYDALLKRKEALEIAIDMMEELSRDFHRDLFPQIVERMKRVLSTVTGKRYKEVYIDESLAMKFLDPATGKLGEVGVLSSGTQDQFMLAFQVALAETLIDQPNLFFLMDDPFIQYDPSRKKQAMEVLSRLSHKHQILYFTCHQADRMQLEKLCPECNTICLK